MANFPGDPSQLFIQFTYYISRIHTRLQLGHVLHRDFEVEYLFVAQHQVAKSR